ncbi:MAG: dihydropteroate synthase [Candidatus Omnitrophica bacterium]|nr:dihydropteroate synthase [Candidatus Omnitrophota bacterium]
MSATIFWKVRKKTFDFSNAASTPLIMGILNLTPDSFSDGGQFLDSEKALLRALELEKEGADIIDVGAESTRPGAIPVSAEEECKRLMPALDLILKEVKIPISLDTTKAKVAELGLKKGVAIINDVSGLKADPEMANVIQSYKAGVVVMHRRGTPETMQQMTDYHDLVSDVLRELEESIRLALAAGISEEQIAIDPGLGFSKTAEQNFEIIRRIPEFLVFGRPVIVGASRKSFLGKITAKQPEERIFASTTMAALLAERGVHVLRVHDVSATRDALLVTKEIIR